MGATIGELTICLGILYLIEFVGARGFLTGLCSYVLNKSAYRKRKKGQSLWEWFSYSRFRDIIPKIFVVYYYFIFLIFPIAETVGVFSHFFLPQYSSSICWWLAIIVFCGTGIPNALIVLFFYRRTGERTKHNAFYLNIYYGQWFKKEECLIKIRSCENKDKTDGR